jgi:serine/threonine protein phosphatase PrpC
MVRFTTLTDIGRRPYQEDRYANQEIIPGITFCGVFDGHGGHAISEMCKDSFPAVIKQGIQDSPYDLSFVINKSFYTIDNLAYHMNVPQEGSTVVYTLITPTTIWFANAGDSASMVGFKDRSFQQMSMEHKVENEKERIQSLGGFITYYDGVARVNGTLNVARSVGDHYMKEYVICKPFLQSISLESKLQNVAYILLVSDGISDVLTPEKLNEIIVNNPSAPREQLINHIINLAKSLGSTDNMTVTLVEF